MKKCVLKHVIYMTKLFTIAFTLQCVSMSLLLANNGNAQVKSIEEVPIHLSLNEVKVEKAFKELERITEFNFVFAGREVRDSPLVSVESHGESLYDLLVAIATQTNLSFKQIDLNIHVKKSDKENLNTMMEFEDVTVSGTVTDDNGEPLPGATVTVAGSSIGTVTDIYGNYTITVPDDSELIFTYIGFEPFRISVNNRSQIDITLKPDSTSLDEVVVIGYGTVKRSDLTGSVSSINVEEAFNAPITRLDQALQGRAAGVQVTSINGAPGTGSTIRIRGGNSITAGNEPLFVIDGVIGGGDLNTISPNDIASIEILKDASATSIYGTRGANGVVLITTKRGNPGVTKFSFNTSHGFQTLPEKIDVQNALEFAQFVNDGSINNASQPPWDLENLPNVDTDWQEAAYRNAYITNSNISLQGGSEKTSVFFSGDYLRQDGIQISSGFERWNFRLNLDYDVSNFLTVGTALTFSHSNRDNSKFNESTLMEIDPLTPIYNSDGTFNGLTSDGRVFPNPIAAANLSTNHTLTNRFLANTYIKFNILKGLTFKSSIGTDFNFIKQNAYSPGSLPNRNIDNIGGAGSVNNIYSSTILNENLVNFQKDFGAFGALDGMAGFTIQMNEEERSRVAGNNLSSDITKFNSLQLTDNDKRTISTGYGMWNILSFLGRVNYSIKDRYLITASVRRDGSSRLGRNEKWATFPSAALAWKITEESFMDNVKAVDFMKLRMSYGITGNQDIPSFSTLPQLGFSDALINGERVVGLVQSTLETPNLKWETTSQFNIGLNFGVLSSRLNFEFDYYMKKTNDLLFEVEIPFVTGFRSKLENIGSLQNHGFEGMVDALILENENFSWSASLNLSTNRNKILDLGGKEFINTHRLGAGSADVTGKLIVGHPLGIFVGFNYEGIDPSTGDLIFEDINNDGVINNEGDQQIIGDSNPDFYGGIQNTITYKNFELNFFFQGIFGNDLYNSRIFQSNTVLLNSYRDIRSQRWTPEQPNDAGAPGANILFNVYRASTFHIQNGSHLRLKTLQLSYNIPTQGIQWLNGLKVYFVGTNLWLLKDKDYLNYDPEISQFGSSPILRGYDIAAYPQSRNYVFGMSINF